MNEVRMPDFGELGASFAQVSSEATRRLCEQGQSVMQTMNEWNAEIGQFLSHRAARNGEAVRRVAQCQNLPDLFGIQARWVQDVTEDYLREIGKLTEFNSAIMGGWIGSLHRDWGLEDARVQIGLCLRCVTRLARCCE